MSDHHVFTAISGFGIRVIPRAPFEAQLGPTPFELDVEHNAPDGQLLARVKADGAGGYTSKCDRNTSSLFDVVDIVPGPRLDRWHLDAGEFLVALPDGYALHSVPADSPSPFDLCGPHDSLIYVQRPSSTPDLDQLVGPGQTVADRGRSCIDVVYDHEGRHWWQRHHVATMDRSIQLWFTAQAPEEHKEVALAALEVVIGSLVPGRSG